jgi:phosphoribosylaminoimidazole-succinocarboxamide synthase
MNLLETKLPGIPLFGRGKVRDIYDLGDKLLFVATDRVSAFDYVLPSAIPDKGKILTSMSVFWFQLTQDIVPNHLVASDFDKFPDELRAFRDQLEGRSLIVKKAQRIDIECVARGYLVGSGYKDYLNQKPQNGQISLHGYQLPIGIMLAAKLPQPIFTPATKEENGHDINIDFEKMASIIGDSLARQLRDLTLSIYSKAADYALTKGIIIADTKFEFGILTDRVILIDEILSPDSSRFWPVATYKPGQNPESFDKQYIRDWLETCGWDKNSPPPELPPEIIAKTVLKYKEAHRLLVGKDID